MLLLLAMLLAAPVLTKGPVIVGVSHDRAFVSWETSQPQQNATLSYGKEPGAYTATAVDAKLRFRHFVKLEGLLPSTKYHFIVDSDSTGEVSQLTTAPPPGSRGPFKFVVYGDNRTQLSPHQDVVNAIRGEADVAFLVHTGDMADNTNPANTGWPEFFAIEHDLLRSKPFFPCIGNHETVADALQHYAQFFAWPTFSWPTNTVKYYSIDWGNAHFVFLDTFEGPLPGLSGISDAQLEWMKADLDAARAAGRHIFAVMHHGPFSHSNHGDSALAQAKVLPELAARGAKAIFQGHDHVYERGCGGGVDYVIAGGGGAPLYKANQKESRGELRFTSSDYSYLVVSVDGDKISARARLTNGNLLDSFELPSGGNCSGLVVTDGGTPDAGNDGGADGGTDGGAADGGPSDGGPLSDAGADAGPQPDPDPPGVPTVGCSCGSSTGAGWTLLPLVAALVALRAGRASRRKPPAR